MVLIMIYGGMVVLIRVGWWWKLGFFFKMIKVMWKWRWEKKMKKS